MLVEEVKKLTPLQRLCFWITERESIRLKKEAGDPKPWSTNEVLQNFRFCNVIRSDDKVSQWLMNNWYTKENIEKGNLVTACVLARQINNIETMTDIGYPHPWNPKRVEAICKKRVADGKKVFNGAYIITGGLGGGTKVEQVIHLVVDPIHKAKVAPVYESLEATHTRLMNYVGMGSFIAGQVVADIKLALNHENYWLDRNTWAPMGPGSKRGMNRLHERNPDEKKNQAKFTKELQELRSQLRKLLPADLYLRMEAMDLQNCLCEFSKMERTLFDSKRPKQLYPGVK
jgi:hypothetical protein